MNVKLSCKPKFSFNPDKKDASTYIYWDARECFVPDCAKVYTGHNSRTIKAFDILVWNIFCKNLNTNSAYKANRLVLSTNRSSLGLDQKR